MTAKQQQGLPWLEIPKPFIPLPSPVEFSTTPPNPPTLLILSLSLDPRAGPRLSIFPRLGKSLLSAQKGRNPRCRICQSVLSIMIISGLHILLTHPNT